MKDASNGRKATVNAHANPMIRNSRGLSLWKVDNANRNTTEKTALGLPIELLKTKRDLEARCQRFLEASFRTIARMLVARTRAT
jgi:hypothetical protein